MKKIEISLLLALAVTLLWGAVCAQRQEALAEQMIRLHVLANSDSQSDQALKLRVRDRVLTYASRCLSATDTAPDAAAALRAALPALEAVAASEIKAQGYHYPVTAVLERTAFPYRDYGVFALPQGEYLALRILIGEAKGRNWWCVVFPALCTGAAVDWETTSLSDGQVGLITGSDSGYVLKFRAVELWQALRQKLGK